MLSDMIVQMMHRYFAWFKMLEAKLCVRMVWLVMCLCMNKVIAWLGCRLFVDMVSQLSLENNVSHCLIGDDLWM